MRRRVRIAMLQLVKARHLQSKTLRIKSHLQGNLSRRCEKILFGKNRQELGVPFKVGSNAAMIGASKSESGNPIMFGGPQVGFTAPGFIYEVGLHGPELDIQGSSFIGYPFIMFGATNDFAFSATAGYGDVSDILEEEVNPNNPMSIGSMENGLNLKENRKY